MNTLEAREIRRRERVGSSHLSRVTQAKDGLEMPVSMISKL
jgi:hypothetical protein